ncbi:MAG: tetratricopeptide repeat protein [Alphaproteobacteria bacterium]|jgi:TPR repeat protein|nr:tetratricopeptide repeat protein [Alphaproteobacteria bacterium]
MIRFLGRLALVAAVGAAVPVAVFGVRAMAETPPAQTAAARSEGEDLYRRGLYPEAIAWWTEQAAKGDVESARRLGVEYMDGKGGVVERDYEKARTYHLQAAKGGERRSMMDLGTIHEHGLGVEADLIEAARWYEWSGKYGYGPGQYNFATMLETGDAGRKDEVEAYKYYLLAAAQGVAGIGYDAKSNRVLGPDETPMGLLARRLTPAQIADAKARVKAFKAMTGPLPA